MLVVAPPISMHIGQWDRPSSRHTGMLVDHSTSKCPTSMGAIHKSMTFSCVSLLTQLNKCVVVCGSDLQRGGIGSGDGSSSILVKHNHSRGHLFVLGWARV